MVWIYDLQLALLNTKYGMCVAESCVSDAHSSMADLRQSLTDTWNGLSRSIENDAIDWML